MQTRFPPQPTTGANASVATCSSASWLRRASASRCHCATCRPSRCTSSAWRSCIAEAVCSLSPLLSGMLPIEAAAAHGDHVQGSRWQPAAACMLPIFVDIQHGNGAPSCCSTAAAAWLRLRRRLPGARCAARCPVLLQSLRQTAGRLPAQRAGRLQHQMRQLLPPQPAALRPAHAGDHAVTTRTHRQSRDSRSMARCAGRMVMLHE